MKNTEVSEGQAPGQFAASRGSAIPFENNKGERMQLAPKLTIADLVKMGVKEIRIVKAEDPLPNGWWRDCGESPND